MSVLRPLPTHPDLEFERKEAKARARRLGVRLAEAQFQIAREYGFASWPKLVRYFRDAERQEYARRPPSDLNGLYPGLVRALISSHRVRRGWAGRGLAAYVPRFYGESLDVIYASRITKQDAQLAVARMHGYPSWDELRQFAEREHPHGTTPLDDPLPAAGKAVSALDLAALKRVTAEHPELLDLSALAPSQSLLSMAIWHEQRLGKPALLPIIEWLTSQGLDLQQTLNERLRGHMYMKPDWVRYLLDRGADPDWIAPDGVPVLECALIRYWSGDAVDILAERATPRRALWISAGLGDVEGVRQSLTSQGRPTKAARRLRPPFDMVGQPGMYAPHPDPTDDEVLLEAFVIALLNGRTNVMEYMVSRGFDVNTLSWDTPLINVAVGNAWVPVVECLVRCGADLDLKGWHPDMTARELARDLFLDAPENLDRRRVVELCGMDPENMNASGG